MLQVGATGKREIERLWLLYIELNKQLTIVDASLTLKMYFACSILDDGYRYESVFEKQYEAFFLFPEKFVISFMYSFEESVQFNSQFFDSVMFIDRVYLLYRVPLTSHRRPYGRNFLCKYV
jgi:hypothetical protein